MSNVARKVARNVVRNLGRNVARMRRVSLFFFIILSVSTFSAFFSGITFSCFRAQSCEECCEESCEECCEECSEVTQGETQTTR